MQISRAPAANEQRANHGDSQRGGGGGSKIRVVPGLVVSKYTSPAARIAFIPNPTTDSAQSRAMMHAIRELTSRPEITQLPIGDIAGENQFAGARARETELEYSRINDRLS
jgi:hypothetical protein